MNQAISPSTVVFCETKDEKLEPRILMRWRRKRGVKAGRNTMNEDLLRLKTLLHISLHLPTRFYFLDRFAKQKQNRS